MKDKKKPKGKWRGKCHGNTPSLSRLLDNSPAKPYELEFVRVYLKTSNISAAARAIGVSSASAYNMLKLNHVVRKLIAEHREKMHRRTHYTAVVAMEEAERSMDLAEATGNATAHAKAVELRAKLNGLIIDKMDTRVAAAFTIAISGIDDPATPKATQVLPPGVDGIARAIIPASLPATLQNESIDFLAQLDSEMAEAEKADPLLARPKSKQINRKQPLQELPVESIDQELTDQEQTELTEEDVFA